MFLSSFAILASLTSISTLLLLITTLFWVVYFVLLSLLNDSHKQLRSLQSTGGDILQLATSYALKDISDLAVFTKAERALQGDDYVVAAQEFSAIADKCDIELTPVGEVHVVEKMLEMDAVIGGEGNGGVILTKISPGRDAATGIILVLDAIARSGKTFEHLLSFLPNYAIIKRKTKCNNSRIDSVVEIFMQQNPKAHLHPIKDGFKIYLKDNLKCPWVHLRPSNTEPVVRIISEAESANEASKICQTIEKMLAKSEIGE